MEKMDGKTLDIVQENINKLKEIFPEAFTEGKIDFDKLKEELGNFTDDREERYSFNWNGKRQAKLIAQTPSTGTLRPCPEESVDWENTKNIFIEGDNLEVLKLLQKSYHKKVKMIYIDPPYNTGKDFVYKDDFKDNIKNYKAITGQLDEEGKNITNNPETSGRYHTDWLNMMYPRLKLARNLLKDDGAIFISIDEGEASNLRKICDEIFGEENFRNRLIVRRRVKSLNVQFADNGLNSMNVGFEYVFVYSKSDDFLMKALRAKKKNVSTKGTWNVFWSGADRPTMRYDLLGFTPTTGQWRWSKEKAEEAIINYNEYLESYADSISLEDYWQSKGSRLKFVRRIENGTGKNGGVQYWIGPSDTALRTSNWTDIEVSQIRKDFDLPFDNPKNPDLIKTLISLCEGRDFLVLDFFAGSGTTAHSVMACNAEDNGIRKCISVQLPEECEAEGFKNIAEISKERISRASAKIKEENPGYNGDLGFKVFKLDFTNIKPWEVDFDINKDVIAGYIDNIKDDRDEHDILYEVLLKFGLDLTLPITEHMIDGQKVYDIGLGALMVCLSDNITIKVAEGIVALKEQLKPEIMRVVLKDSGFGDKEMDANVVKANILHILKDAGVEDVRSL